MSSAASSKVIRPTLGSIGMPRSTSPSRARSMRRATVSFFVPVLSRTARPFWWYLIHRYGERFRAYTLPIESSCSNLQVVWGLVGPTRRVIRAGGPVVGSRGSMLPPRRRECQRRLRLAHASAVPTFARFDERIKVCSIDQHPSQGLSLAIALACTERRHIHCRDQALQD